MGFHSALPTKWAAGKTLSRRMAAGHRKRDADARVDVAAFLMHAWFVIGHHSPDACVLFAVAISSAASRLR
jgi:hypothetical protein